MQQPLYILVELLAHRLALTVEVKTKIFKNEYLLYCYIEKSGYILCVLEYNFYSTVDPLLKHCPIGHKNVVCQDRWSLETG